MPEARHLGADDTDAADRLRTCVVPQGLGDAAVVPHPLLEPPSPDTVVAVSLCDGLTPEERARAREAALRARHAAEVAHLRAALRAMEEAHAAEVARLRAERAGDTAGLGRAVAKPLAGGDLIGVLRALGPAGAAALSRLRGAVLPPH